MPTWPRITPDEEELVKTEITENSTNANILIPKRGRFVIVSKNEIQTNKIQRTNVQNTVIPVPQPSAIPPKKVISFAVIKNHTDEITVQQMAANESTVEETHSKLPYISPSQNEIEDDVVYDDPGMLLDYGENFNDSDDGLDMDLDV